MNERSNNFRANVRINGCVTAAARRPDRILTAVVFLLCALSQAAPVDPARSQALLKTLSAPEASVYDKARACQQAGEFGTADLVPALAALLGDDRLAAYARSGLENIPGDAAAAALRDALAKLKGELLAGVIDSIAVRRDAQAVPALAALAADAQSPAAGPALAALGAIADDASVAVLQRILRTAPDALRADAAGGVLLAAQRRLAAGDAPSAAVLCDAVLAAALPKHLHAAALCGAIRARGTRDTEYLLRHLASADRDIRNAARLAAASLGPSGALTKILAEAVDREPDQARKALLDDALLMLCFKPLINGRRFSGWEGDIKKSFRREDDAIVGGTLNETIPRNEFLATVRPYTNFILRADCRLIGDKANAGIQIRTARIPGHHEVIGYQADMSSGKEGGYWGKLYDESRRKKVLGTPLNHAAMLHALRPEEWNHYEIRCEGARIQLFLNGVKTLDYTEEDPSIPLHGIIALQIHSGPPSEAWYRNVQIAELP
jgi:hypothetical protein